MTGGWPSSGSSPSAPVFGTVRHGTHTGRREGSLAPLFHPELCSRFRGQREAPAPKVEKVRKPLNRLAVFDCKTGSTLISPPPPLLSVDSDREDGSYCPPAKRERTSSLTQFPPAQPGNSRRLLLNGKRIRVRKPAIPFQRLTPSSVSCPDPVRISATWSLSQ